MAKTQKASQSKFNKAAAELHGAYPAEPPAKRVRVKSKEPPASQAEAPPTELPPSTVGTAPQIEDEPTHGQGGKHLSHSEVEPGGVMAKLMIDRRLPKKQKQITNI